MLCSCLDHLLAPPSRGASCIYDPPPTTLVSEKRPAELTWGKKKKKKKKKHTLTENMPQNNNKSANFTLPSEWKTEFVMLIE